MKNILKIFALILASATLLTSCIEETYPTSGVLEDDVILSPSMVEDMLGGIPANMLTPYSVYSADFDFGYPSILCVTDACTGDVICSAGDAGSGYDWFFFWESNYYIGPIHYADFVWNYYYKAIKNANDLLRVLPVENLTYAQSVYKAYAKLFRAQFYLDMARMYEPLQNEYTSIDGKILGLTVPIVTENTTETEARSNPRATRAEMFSFILKDVDESIAALEGLTASGTLPSQAVAYGIKARAYLWLGGFEEDVPAGEDVYEGYLLGAEAYAEAAACARKAIDLSGAKIMLESEWVNRTNGFNMANSSWMWYLSQTTENVTSLANFVAQRSSEAIWGYGGLFVFPGVTSNFYKSISNTDWRKRAFVGPDAEYDDYKDVTNYSKDDFGGVPPYANFKFHPAGGNMNNSQVGNVTDIPLMRVEEMYLIEAEATAHINTNAGIELFAEFMSHRDPAYVPSFYSLDDVFATIIRCKQIEFWGEGVIFYDKKRLNYPIETGYEGTNAPADVCFATEGRPSWWNFCIPEGETELNLALQGFNNPDPSNTVPYWRGN